MPCIFFTFVTWFCRHLEDSSWCSPSGRGQRRRFCRLFGRSWHFRSWWHHFLDTAGRWGSPRRTALAVLSQTAGRLDWTLKGEETQSSISPNANAKKKGAQHGWRLTRHIKYTKASFLCLTSRQLFSHMNQADWESESWSEPLGWHTSVYRVNVSHLNRNSELMVLVCHPCA